VQALRALRAVRPLRTINRMENLRAIVVAFLEALPMLGSVVLLTVLALSLWALVSMQLFMGMYHTACREDSTGKLEVTRTAEFSCGARRCVTSAYSNPSYLRVCSILLLQTFTEWVPAHHDASQHNERGSSGTVVQVS
jgi:hypothetical protein